MTCFPVIYFDIPREMQRIDQYVEKLKQETL